jgi:hypothetical protein
MVELWTDPASPASQALLIVPHGQWMIARPTYLDKSLCGSRSPSCFRFHGRRQIKRVRPLQYHPHVHSDDATPPQTYSAAQESSHAPVRAPALITLERANPVTSCRAFDVLNLQLRRGSTFKCTVGYLRPNKSVQKLETVELSLTSTT